MEGVDNFGAQGIFSGYSYYGDEKATKY
jgi:hypothetical protein